MKKIAVKIIKPSLKWSVPIIGIVAIILSTILILFPTSDTGDNISFAESIPIPQVLSLDLQSLIKGESSINVLAEKSSANFPVRLVIPKIKVDAIIERLGLTPSGAMAVPKGPNDVAWFNLGPRPGEIGSAVIGGHYGWKNNIPAVFDNLKELKKSDVIYTLDDIGATTTFVVREIGIYDQNADATNVFNSSDGKEHLNLITCEGIWNEVSKSRPNRLVIFADKEIK